jgi:uncharacterized protein with WD repeat
MSMTLSGSGEKQVGRGRTRRALLLAGCAVVAGGSASIALYVTKQNHGQAPLARLDAPDGAGVLVFSGDGVSLACVVGSSAQVWNIATKKVAATFVGVANVSGGNDPVECLALRSQDMLLAVGSSQIELWAVGSRSLRRSLVASGGKPYCMNFAPNGDLLACGYAYTPDHQGNVIRLWDVSTGKEVATLTGHTGAVSSVVFSPNGMTLASSGMSEQADGPQSTTDVDHTIRIWEVPGSAKSRILSGHADSVNQVAFSPDGRTLASCSDDGSIRLWNTGDWQAFATLTAGSDAIVSIAFSPDGRTLASGGTEQTVRLWDVASRQTKKALTGHEGNVTSLAFSPNGQILASASEDQTILLWAANS